MLNPGGGLGNPQCSAFTTSSDAHVLDVELFGVGGGHGLFVRELLPNPFRHNHKLFVVHLHEVEVLHACQDLVLLDERRTQIHVKHAPAARLEHGLDGGGGGGVSLRQATKDDSRGAGGGRQQLRGGLNAVPRRGLHDVVGGDAVVAHKHLHKPRWQFLIRLQEVAVDATTQQAASDLLAQNVVPHARHAGSGNPQLGHVLSHVHRGASQKQTQGESIPQRLPDAQHWSCVRVRLARHSSRNCPLPPHRPGPDVSKRLSLARSQYASRICA
mmetsp:Transcript_28424/g.54183  ORF Transcript_28424/g.54183 Transcript_28424/m.54183 type:complete len:271 (+) Transcript_28424:392-1204(+)